MFGLLKTFYIKPNERGMLFYRSHFQEILMPGTHHRMGLHWNVKIFDLNTPKATIDNVELLLQSHADVLNEQFVIVRTAFNQAALVRVGQQWQAIAPNQLRLFWRGFIEVEAHCFDLDAGDGFEGVDLPTAFVDQVKDQAASALAGLKVVRVSEFQIGMLYIQDNFVRPLGPGEYGFWTFGQTIRVTLYDRTKPIPGFNNTDVLMEQRPEFVAEYCESVTLGAEEVAIARHQGKVIGVLTPTSRQLFWRGVEVEVIDLNTNAKLPARLVKELVSGLPAVFQLAHHHLHITEVPSQHVGLLYAEGALQETLEPGWHVWWLFGRSLKTEVLDLRLQTLDVSGQEILSKDKVPLRLNLTAGYRIVDPVKAKAGLADIKGFLYKELQFALRVAVGTRSLDELLEDKGAIDSSVADYILSKTAEYGIEVESVGV